MQKSIVRVVLGVIIVPILSFLGYWGYLTYLAPPPPTPDPTPSGIAWEQEPQVISAEGEVVPLKQARLSFNVPGLVNHVVVEEGDQVQQGDLIASLTGREQVESAVAAAELELISAEQELEELIDLAPMKTAEAQQELANAQDTLEDAQRRWRNNQEGNRATSETVEETEDNLALAEEALERAQKEYNKYANRPEDDPVRAIAYSVLLTARRSRDRLLGLLNWYQGEPSNIEQAQLDADLAMAEARLAEAVRQWEKRKDGPDPDQVALLEARVESAQAQLKAAQASLEDLELRAPFRGTIVSLDLKEGESINPGVPLVVLADISQWRVETIDLTEIDFALISPGMEANITLNAYPERDFRGVVREISLVGEEYRGSVTYTVTLDFEPQGEAVQWGMTAFVDIPLP
jgi:multidrug resistance efflux pump